MAAWNDQKLKIVSDGSGMGTRLVMPDGTVVPGVTRIDLRPITSDGEVEAVITCVGVALDIDVSREFVEQLMAAQDGPDIDAAQVQTSA